MERTGEHSAFFITKMGRNYGTLSLFSWGRGQKDLKTMLNPERWSHLVCFPQSLLVLFCF